MDQESVLKLLDEMIEHQKGSLLTIARRYRPNITDEDLLQPNDYPELENHPIFRYEEGVLEGMQSAKMALIAMIND